jgi:hypothetical protein
VDLNALATELDQEFVESRDVPGLGEVVTPRVPIDLGMVLTDLFEGEFRDGEEAFRMFVRAGHLQTLISFTWEEDGAEPFESSLEIITFGSRSYLTISPDEASDQEWEVFVGVDDATPESWEALLAELCRDNGMAFGMEIFSSLPTRTDSVAIAPRFVLAVFFSYLQWDESRSPGAWKVAAEYLPAVLRGNPSVTDAASRLLREDTKQNRFSFISSYVAAVCHDPAQGLSVVAAS